jgi:hypothetical protein
MAGPTRLELATSDVTGRRSNQLNYDPALNQRRRIITHNFRPFKILNKEICDCLAALKMLYIINSSH